MTVAHIPQPQNGLTVSQEIVIFFQFTEELKFVIISALIGWSHRITGRVYPIGIDCFELVRELLIERVS